MVLLWLILGVNLYDIVYSLTEGQFGIYLLGAELPPLWSFFLTHASPIARVIAVFAMLRGQQWRFYTYLYATFFFLLFCTVPEFEPYLFSMQMALFIALAVLFRQKWHEFD